MVEMTTNERDRIDAVRPLARITLAQGLFLLLLLLAGVMRLSQLDALPLSPAEAEEALAVWQFRQPAAEAVAAAPASGASPAYFSLTTLLATIAGYGDATVRLAPALAGVLLVALPWFWRERLGTAGALATGALLAASPTAALLARTAGGEGLAAPALLLLLLAWTRYRSGGGPRWLYTAAVALGAGLATGPLFFGGLLTLAAAWLVQARFGPALPPAPSPDGQENDGQQVQRALLAGAATFAGLATLLFWHPAGLAQAAGQLGAWAGQFTLSGGPVAWLSPLLLLGRYEMGALLLGVGAIVWATWQGRPFSLFLVYWFAAALILALLQHGTPANVLLLLLPLALLSGQWLRALFSRPAGPIRWGLVVALLILGAIIYFNGARYLRVAVYTPEQASFLLMAGLALLLGVIAFNVVRTWDAAAAAQGSVLALLLLFLIFQWGTGWWLTHEAANDPRAGWAEVGTDGDVRLLASLLTEVSQQRDGSNRGVEIVAAVDSPLLRWYLRDFANLQMGGALPPGTTAPVLLTPAGSEPALGDAYFGMDLGLRHTGVNMIDSSPGSALRWWLFRDSATRPVSEKIILWVRNETE